MIIMRKKKYKWKKKTENIQNYKINKKKMKKKTSFRQRKVLKSKRKKANEFERMQEIKIISSEHRIYRLLKIGKAKR